MDYKEFFESTLMESKLIDSFKKFMKEFENACDKFDDYGAGDSEPRYVFKSLILKALKGKFPSEKPDAEYWQLFTDSFKKSELTKASNALNKPLYKAFTFIKKLDDNQKSELIDYMEDY